jgi:hypothetical protein
MFLEALTSRFHVVFFGLLPRALVLQWSTLWTFDGPWRPGLRFGCGWWRRRPCWSAASM